MTSATPTPTNTTTTITTSATPTTTSVTPTTTTTNTTSSATTTVYMDIAGTGKTLCARAVANRTDACFIRVIGSELVQRYVGEVGKC